MNRIRYLFNHIRIKCQQSPAKLESMLHSHNLQSTSDKQDCSLLTHSKEFGDVGQRVCRSCGDGQDMNVNGAKDFIEKGTHSVPN